MAYFENHFLKLSNFIFYVKYKNRDLYIRRQNKGNIWEYKDKIPFQVVEFAKEIGIDVYQDDLPSNISGQIEQQDNNKFIISVNKENAINRQVFTIAHELGHYFRHQNWFEQHKIITEKEEKILFNTFQKDQPQNYSNEEKQREKEANEFAAELLMPEEIVQQKWYEYKSVPKMANYFGVSEISMSIRLGNVIDDLRFIV